MNIQLPEVVEAYFQASNSYDSDLLGKCFTEDAILYDEGLTYPGSNAVVKHIVEANKNLLIKTVVTDATEKNEETVVTATISGNFDGSPVALDYHFTMENQKISTLNIVMAGIG
ncbi:nuclear transport factor 2 family protein [Paenibacillus sp. 2TAF8]|jgi:ketosteroid isomerase-like protein|uniref:nuclear transport factor 2 family protein n=1 Tax=Paenibacillus sp. 2TAF8 TaxID=3233020 RepID=UPI003F995D53